MNEEYKEIKIEELINSYKPGLGKKIPKFIIKYLNKIFHLAEINEFNKKFTDLPGAEFATEGLALMGVKYRAINFKSEKLKDLTNPIFVSNHPLGAPEAIACLKELAPIMPNLKMISRKYMKMVINFAPYVIPVTERREFLESLKADIPLLMYPAGKVSRYFNIKGKKELIDLKWQDSVIKFATRYNRPIVAINCKGVPYAKFHRLSKIRKSLGMKTTIEAIYLVDAMFNVKEEVVITLGDVIYPEKLTKDVSNQEWANRISSYVHELKDNPDASFDYEKENTMLIVENY